MLEKFVPRFLKRADQFLLKNHPLIWRTKIHFVVFYSLILGNIGVVGLGLLYPVSMKEVPNSDLLEMLMLVSCALAAFGLIWWGYSQYKVPLRSGSFKTYVITGLLYLFGTISIWFNVLNLNSAIQIQIAHLEEENQLEVDMNSGTYDFSKSKDLYYPTSIFSKYKINTYVQTPDLKHYNYKLERKFQKILFAQHFIANYPNYNPEFNNQSTWISYDSTYQLFYMFSLVGFMTIPFCLLLISTARLSVLFLTIFCQVLVLFGAIWFTEELRWLEPISYYSLLSACLGLAILMTKGNRKWTPIALSMLASMLGITLFVIYMEQMQYPMTMYFSTMLLYGFASIVAATVVLYLFGKRAITPKIN